MDDNSILSPAMSLQGREALIAFYKSVRELQGQTGNIICNPLNIHRLNPYIDEQIGRENRLKLYSWLTGREIKTTKDLNDREAAGMLRFTKPEGHLEFSADHTRGKTVFKFTPDFYLAIQALKETMVKDA